MTETNLTALMYPISGATVGLVKPGTKKLSEVPERSHPCGALVDKTSMMLPNRMDTRTKCSFAYLGVFRPSILDRAGWILIAFAQFLAVQNVLGSSINKRAKGKTSTCHRLNSTGLPRMSPVMFPCVTLCFVVIA